MEVDNRLTAIITWIHHLRCNCWSAGMQTQAQTQAQMQAQTKPKDCINMSSATVIRSLCVVL